MPEPMIAPMPRAVSDHGPRDFGSRCPGLSESEISLSMDFLAKSWLARKASLELRDASDGPEKTAMRRRSAPKAPLRRHQCLALGRSANHLLHLGLLGAPRVFARLLWRLLLARCALCFLAFFLAQCLRICHVPVLFKDILRKSLRPLQVRVLFHQLFQSESWKLYRNLRVFSFTFATIHHSLAIFRVFRREGEGE